MRYFRDLDVWQHARDLTLKVYRVTESFPASERFGLTAQIRRAAVSVTANIAEGCGRRTDCEFARFLDIAMGSASDVVKAAGKKMRLPAAWDRLKMFGVRDSNLHLPTPEEAHHVFYRLRSSQQADAALPAG